MGVENRSQMTRERERERETVILKNTLTSLWSSVICLVHSD